MKNVKDFVFKYPNNMELGTALRANFNSIEDPIERNLVEARIKQYPNDSDLGKQVRNDCLK